MGFTFKADISGPNNKQARNAEALRAGDSCVAKRA
ncbi:MAG: hypothetical protein ACI8W8_001746 [Rhodothermales bacterium]|jgi:hypothetical protein